jgi:Zn-dependent peptidase ImmA (M78 family)/DNA-binding XRE family transcriptional regulator
MVAMARLASGLTQEKCAEEIGISQARLSKVEDGLVTTLPKQAVDRLAKVSGYVESFFYQNGQRVSLGDGFFRRRKVIPAQIFKMCEALINIKRMEIEKLLPKVEIESLERPQWDPDEFRNGAREIARHLRNFWEIPQGPIKDLTVIAENAGCVIVHFDFGSPKIDGLTTYATNGTPIILLNPKVSYVRMRATLAHELGHVIMHRIPRAEMDQEAFDFASEFMMPELEIRPELFPVNMDKLIRLKMKWRVAIQWILKWANRIGVLKDSYYRVLMMKISQMGWRKCEIFDDEWNIETSSLLREIIDFHQADLGYSREDMVNLLLPNLKTFERDYFGAAGALHAVG